MQKPFIILSLPRSRSTWLSHFLSYPPYRCGHDIGAESSSVEDFLNRLAQFSGSCETGAVIGWRLIRKLIPQATLICIKRPVLDIKQSLRAVGIKTVHGELEARRVLLDQCSCSPGVQSFDYEELGDPEICRSIFERCLGLWLDPKWYRRYARKNIQVDVAEQYRKLVEGRERMEAFKAQVAAMQAETCSG